MVAYTRGRVSHLLKVDFIRFCIVGGTGFIINFIILTALTRWLNAPIYVAQFIGAEIALFSNFMLHHHWTYKGHGVEKSILTLIVQFHATSWPAIVGSTLMVTAFERLLHFDNLLALAVSSVIALLWNFGWTRYVIWRRVTSAEIERIAK
jgi:dolichol-phosphate mannosyltransferase